jgi:hypothetical protein
MTRYLSLFIFVAGLWASPAEADLIDFTQVSIGPANTIQFEGVTITGGTGFAAIEGTPREPEQVSMVAGLGLGMGADGSFDVRSVFDNGGQFNASRSAQDLTATLSVNGRINSLAIQPYMHVEGPDPTETTFLHFRIGGKVDHRRTDHAELNSAYWVHPPFAPFTIDYTQIGDETRDLRPVSLINFGMFWYDLTQSDLFRPYMLLQGFPDATFTYGFSITALDYTPDPVPEPATWLLVGLGSLLVARRQRLRRT